jgi:pSer/pThr/pTyr-binding forkhead associated (FHA) protein
MKIQLITAEKTGHQRVFTLQQLPARIERTADVALWLDDPYVSRRHCELEQLGCILVVHDLGS